MNVINHSPNASELRSFGLTFGCLGALLLGLVIPWVWDLEYRLWPWLAGAVLCMWGLVAPLTLAWLYRAWMRFGAVMSKITTPLILGVVFLFALLPTALFMRIVLRRDPMTRSLDSRRNSGSGWEFPRVPSTAGIK